MTRGFFGNAVYALSGVKLGEPSPSECAACPEGGAELCDKYVNEKYCALDPCNLGCYPQLDNKLRYVSCEACEQADCSAYFTEEYCHADTCNLGCTWENNVCIPGQDTLDAKRTFKICVTQETKVFVFNDRSKKVEDLPISIKFALNIPDTTPPPPVEKIDAVDHFFAEKHVLLKWKTSSADDVEKYLIYYRKGTQPITEITPDLQTSTAYLKDAVFGDFKETKLIDVELAQAKEQDKKPQYQATIYVEADKATRTGFIEIAKDKLYHLYGNLQDNDDDYFLYSISVPDHEEYAFAVVGSDFNNNIDSNIQEYVIKESIDDLPPDQVPLEELSYDTAGTITIRWKYIDKNADESLLEDWAGYKVYRRTDKSDPSTETLIDTITEKKDEYTEIYPSETGVYYAIIGFDEVPNEYKKATSFMYI